MNIKLESLLKKNRVKVIASIMAFAFILRLGFFISASTEFPVSLHKWESGDMNFFHEWGNLIKEGDILTDTVFHPFHPWHKEIAVAYFKMHPDEKLKRTQELGDQSKIYRDKINEWFKYKQFHQEPLYPYIIGLLYSLFGSNPIVIFIFQTLLGLISIFLIFLISERYFGILPASISALLASLAGSFYTYEFVLLRVSLITFFTLLVLFFIQKALDNPTKKNWFILGVISALALLVKLTFIIFLFGIGALLIITKKHNRITKKEILLFGIGFILAFSPLLIRNVAASVPLLSTSSVGAITAISPNHFYNKTGSFNIDASIYAEILDKSNASTFGSLYESIKSHPSIFSYINSLFQRTSQAFSWVAHTDNINHHFWATKFNVLKLTPINFWIISPLFFVGFFFCLYQEVLNKIWPLIIMLVSTLAPLILFYVFERYRLPLLSVFILFSGVGLQKLLNFNSRKNWIIAIGIFFISFIWVNQVFNSNKKGLEDLIRYTDIYVSYIFHNDENVVKLAENKRFHEASDILKGYLNDLPSYLYSDKFAKDVKSEEQIRVIKYAIKLHSINRDLSIAAGESTKVEEEKRLISKLERGLK